MSFSKALRRIADELTFYFYFIIGFSENKGAAAEVETTVIIAECARKFKKPVKGASRYDVHIRGGRGVSEKWMY